MLWLGLTLFVVIHLLPSMASLRGGVIAQIGEGPYKGGFSLLSLVGLVLIGFGFAAMEFTPIYEPPVWGPHLTFTLMPLVFILLAAAHMKGHIRQKLRHPMMIGVLLWSIGHLAANGDQASVAMFGVFALYSIISIVSAELRGKRAVIDQPLVKFDLMAIVGGLVVFAVILMAHPFLFGVQPTL